MTQNIGYQKWLMFAALLAVSPAMAEYGDVILNNYAEKEGMRPVVFPHWFHRIRFRCKVCHNELGFEMKVGSNDVTMTDIIEGKFCGMCHNGNIAWSVENCDLCHSGKPGLKPRIVGGHQTGGPGRW
ncbi:MAG: cytochrome c3 family protein [Candidatus Thiodiazotropha sp. (ex Lucinoma borealis)]|nr:cytochrome c3 family protein [Candidatus Thiodiazotropha sp. (ex Lucinoma borealis)]MCU7855471.1 cytochrome c3 family protein [Candidatus Thiodiazotropha sp. (ex Lucinoma borealis)]MCU7868580.1 cytochrome c3 family protein [Candidatus Thiodiazotropha sp. (ex Lucinoma borealis)]